MIGNRNQVLTNLMKAFGRLYLAAAGKPVVRFAVALQEYADVVQALFNLVRHTAVANLHDNADQRETKQSIGGAASAAVDRSIGRFVGLCRPTNLAGPSLCGTRILRWYQRRNIRIRPSVKDLASARAAADHRSLAAYIELLIIRDAEAAKKPRRP